MSEARKRIVKKIGLVGVVLLAAAVCMGASVDAGRGTAACRESDPACSGREAQAILEKAFQEARASGKTAQVVVEPEVPGRVQVGDLAVVHYTARLADGSLVRTSRPEVLGQPGLKRAPGVEETAAAGPEEVLAGKPGGFPGLALGVLDAEVDKPHRAAIPAEKAFGKRDPQKIQQFPCERRVPLKIEMGPREYVGRFDAFPVAGKEIQLNPYLRAKVLSVAESRVELAVIARDGEKIDGPLGETLVRVENEAVRLTLVPVIGATFEMENAKGRVVSTDGSTFTVDFNHPLAGKEILFEIEVLSLGKASAFRTPLPWVEDHDQGLKAAGAEKKNMMLVLYAGWCSWSKKLLEESLEDPRIKRMRERFVWVKVDSDKEQAYKEAYGQNGFPMVVVLSPKGEVLKKIDGYRDAAGLKRELEALL